MFELSKGQVVAGKYRIDGILGTGAVGVVAAATHVGLEQRVAIKFLREVSPEARARFGREARALVRLKSDHVARVIDVGSTSDDTPYIVMEHLEGRDLSSLAEQRGRLPVEEAVDYVLQACEAVAEAHALGLVHRDLKPANLFLARGAGGTPIVKVLDFGISKILDDRSSGVDLNAPRGGDLTNEGVALGSPGYMSPEQMTSSRDVDARSDIFSLGAVLYRLTSGRTPYRGASVVTILATMATEGLKPLRAVAPDVPDAFADAVERSLAPDKALRFPTVAHLAHALSPFASRRGRVSIEQIAATLGVDLPQSPSESRVRAPMSTPRHLDPLPPAPVHGPEMGAGPHFRLSSGRPLPLPAPTPRAVASRASLFAGIALFVVMILVGIAATMLLRR